MGRDAPRRRIAQTGHRHRQPARHPPARQQRRSKLAAALQEYGRLVKTEFILRYLTHPDQRRSIHRQLNKGESINALEDAIFYGNEGRIRLHSVDHEG